MSFCFAALYEQAIACPKSKSSTPNIWRDRGWRIASSKSGYGKTIQIWHLIVRLLQHLLKNANNSILLELKITTKHTIYY